MEVVGRATRRKGGKSWRGSWVGLRRSIGEVVCLKKKKELEETLKGRNNMLEEMVKKMKSNLLYFPSHMIILTFDDIRPRRKK